MELVFPGEIIDSAEEVELAAFSGVYKWRTELRSFQVGTPRLENTFSSASQDILASSAVKLEIQSPARKARPRIVVPLRGARVCARVLRVNRRQAIALILLIDDVPARGEFQGLIRQQDILEDNWDSVCVYEYLQPGDLIEARVLSDLEQRYYYLSIASTKFLLRR
jgi:exosome complex RNA-binding protein Csl4